MKVQSDRHRSLKNLSAPISSPHVVPFMQFKIQPDSIRNFAFAWLLLISTSASGQQTAEHFFEAEVRPLLISKCGKCHGAEKVSGGLRVDSRKSLIVGGDSGRAIIAGNPEASLLIQAVRRIGDMPMPPDEELSQPELEVFTKWIEIGAPWMESDKPQVDSSIAAQTHWAFQPIRRPDIPEVTNQEWIRTPIDAFVLSQLERNDLTGSPVVDRRALIRRISYALTGLPPTLADVDRFVANPDPDALEHLIERLLESPQYGEHWARHWLDVARYSDTKGYVYAREERHWVHAWAYRDWVAKSLNDDMPYDRFLLLQLAADQIDDRRDGDLAAMGFLTLGRRFLGVRRDIIDDRIDVVCRGTMGLTVACARCHNHKYDPIPTADYYSLYGVFDSCHETMVALQGSSTDKAFETELAARKEKLHSKLTIERRAASDRACSRVADYLFAQSELDKFPADGFDQIFEKQDLLPAFVRRWETYLRTAKLQGDPIFTAWHAYAELPTDSFGQQSADVTDRLLAASADEVDPIVRQAFLQPPGSFREVCDRYGELLADKFPDFLRGPHSPCQVPDEPIVQIETFFDTGTLTEIWKLQGEVDRWIIESEVLSLHAVALVDKPTPVEPRIFRRGDPVNQGENVPRQFLSLLSGDSAQPFQHGSGRLELAQAIIDPENPLTARVIVNRVWAHHFGQGLVTTPSDFGTRADPPSHPELLDWLALEFVASGWSLKYLHRLILLSSTYQQSGSGPIDPGIRQRAMQADPNNRWLWKSNARRLSFEELRDSLLAATNDLDRSVGGKPRKLFASPFPNRRTLYGFVDRQYLPGTLRMFDFANPDLHTPQRIETTVPQQALFLMNHPLVLERAQKLAELTESDQDPNDRIASMFRQTLQRDPTSSELEDSISLVNAAFSKSATPSLVTRADWQYGYGTFDEAANRVTGFTPLPHFTGTAWQGGESWPDPTLGWVQLTATGGHPGNDRSHAAIRRWTAPRDGTIRMESTLKHEPTAGDGIRVFVVGSNHGLLQSESIHHREQEITIESLAVAKGDHVDFVVDIGDVLNSDQFLWKATIQTSDSPADNTIWDSVQDFSEDPVAKLDGWAQLAQVLFCTNEFMFVD